jgi:hypothetical protein
MDVNDLYHRHQVSLFLSENAASVPSRAVHRGLTEGYASRIDAVKNALSPLDIPELRIVDAEGSGEIIA